MLVRLLYTSRASAGIDEALLDGILEGSTARNQEHGITGLLCACPKGGVFLQALEGGSAAVNSLYANIVCDPRHKDVTLLDYTEIDERRFSNWRMGQVDLENVNPGMVLRFSETAELDPFSISAWAAQAFLEEMATTASIGTRDRG